MMDMGGDFKDPDQIAELKKSIKTFTSILASSIRSYVARTQKKGRDRDPGTWNSFATRFKPMVGAKGEGTSSRREEIVLRPGDRVVVRGTLVRQSDAPYRATAELSGRVTVVLDARR